MKKRNKLKGHSLPAYQKALIRRKEESETNLAKRICQLLYNLDARQKYNFIYNIASDHKLPSLLNPVYGEDREHYELAGAPYNISNTGFTIWLAGLIKKNSNILSEFERLRTLANIYILQKNADLALDTLDEIDKLSKSWWSISMRTHIIKELKKEDTKTFLASIPEKIRRAKVEHSVFRLQLMSESSSIGLYLENFKARLREYRSSGSPQVIAMGANESCQHLPLYLDPERNPSIQSMAQEAHESILDQYLLFKEIALELSCTSSLPIPIKDQIQKLVQLIDDQELASVVCPAKNPSPVITEIVLDYTLGSYHAVIKRIESLLIEGDAAIFGLLDIYAKSKIYLNMPFNRVTFFDSLAADLSEILDCKESTQEKIDNLTKLIIKFRSEPWARSLAFHLQSLLEETAGTKTVEMARLGTHALGKNNTQKALLPNSEAIVPFRLANNIPSYRSIKYFPEKHVSTEVQKIVFPIKSEFLKFQSRQLLKHENLKKAMDFVSKEYQKNHVSFYHLPFYEICERVASLNDPDFDTRILSLIMLDIFAREQSKIYEELKSELFEEFMMLAGTHRPSELFKDKVLDKHSIFFLNNICITSQLDNLFHYKTNDEVVLERVAIIDILKAAQPESEVELRIERDKVLENLFAEKLRAKIESGKLFVDVQALESQRKQLYKSLFSQAKTIEGGVRLDYEENIEKSKDLFPLSDNNAIASTNKSEMLYTIHMQSTEDFALNETYGLDKYLSAEIRHMVFNAQIRSCFERTNLVTAKKQNSYLSNSFWLHKYSYVNPRITSVIDALLGDFSRKVDEALDSTNEKFRVDARIDSDTGVFDFKPYLTRLINLSEIIDECDEFDDFFDKLLQYLWNIAGEGAREAQLLISNSLRTEIGQMIDDLEQSVSEIDGVSFFDLKIEIRSARTSFLKEIEVVTNWFKFVGSRDSQSLERLGSVVEASVSSFESIYGHLERSLEFTQAKTDLTLTYREARSLFIAIFTALENAYKYSEPHTPVKIEHVRESEANSISITNKAFPPLEDPDTFIADQKSKWTPAHVNLNREEGGTGLYKIFSSLSETSNGFAFDISTTNDLFTAEMRLNNAYFNNRR